MARILKDVVSYFPHDADAANGDTLTVLQSRFGNNGYAFWFKLLEKLASAEGHYLDCRNSTKWQLLLAKTGVDELTGVEIMKMLVEMQAIDKDLWKLRVIWCQKLVDNVSDVYMNRRREIPQKPITTEDNAITTERNCIVCSKSIVGMREDTKYCSPACKQKAFRVTDKSNADSVEMPITTEDNAITTEDNAITTGGNPQSKVKYSRVNNIYMRFEVFWKAYPKKKSKGQAEKVFAKINPDEQLLATMLATIERAKKSEDWQKEGGQYIPYPATWLSAKGWEDEIQKGGQSGTHRQSDKEPSAERYRQSLE